MAPVPVQTRPGGNDRTGRVGRGRNSNHCYHRRHPPARAVCAIAREDRDRLRTSLIEQARAQRLAGNRFASLEALRKAAELGRDDELRFEAIATIVRPGLAPLGEEVHGGGGRFQTLGWCSTNPKVNAEGNVVALPFEVWPEQAGNSSPAEKERIDIFEIPSGKLLRRKAGRYFAVGFRPGSPQLALYRRDQETSILLWDYSTDREVGRFEHSARLDNAAISPDGSYLLATDAAGKIVVWNLADRSEAKAPLAGEFQGFLSGHELLLVDQRRFKSWDCKTGQERWLMPVGLTAGNYSPAARLAIVWGKLPKDTQTYYVWDLVEGKSHFGEIPGLAASRSAATFSPNGRYLVFDDAAEEGQSMRVWDLRLHRFTVRCTPPRGCAPPSSCHYRSFNPDGSLLASAVVTGAGREALCIWDTVAGEVLTVLPGPDGREPVGCDWSSDGRRLIIRYMASVRCWEVIRPVPSCNGLFDRFPVLEQRRQPARGRQLRLHGGRQGRPAACRLAGVSSRAVPPVYRPGRALGGGDAHRQARARPQALATRPGQGRAGPAGRRLPRASQMGRKTIYTENLAAGLRGDHGLGDFADGAALAPRGQGSLHPKRRPKV